MSDIQSYHVKWFVTREVRTDVTVRIAQGKLQSVERGFAPDAVDLGNAALIDGLVNAHTHLEFSGLDRPLPMSDQFTDWIRAVIKYRLSPVCNIPAAIQTGLKESLEAGTTVLGDIATTGWSWDDYKSTTLNGIVFQELLGLLPERIGQQQQLAHAIDSRQEARFRPGISPHAPYSTHWHLVGESVALANKKGFPLAMHLAETRAELELLAQNTGSFREMLSDFGLWNEDATRFARRPLDYLKLLAQTPRSLVIHGNYLDDEELSFLADQTSMTLVYCPRTHAAFGHQPHPWRRARQLGVRVALGTDSRASNPDLSIFRELQFLAARHPAESQVELLELGSRAGRVALGFGQPDRADFTLVRLDEAAMGDAHRDLFSPANRVCGTMIDGIWRWRDDRMLSSPVDE